MTQRAKNVISGFFIVVLTAIVVFVIWSCYHYRQEQRIEGLRDHFRQKIFVEQTQNFIEKEIRPWSLFNTGKTQYGEMLFSGTPQEVFWNTADIFLESLIMSNFQFAVEFYKEKEIPKDELLLIVKDILASSIDQVYGEMQRIDRKLRGNGCPEFVKMRDVSDKLQFMHALLSKQYQAQLQIKPKPSLNRFYRENPFWFWVIDHLFPYVAGLASPFLFRKVKSIRNSHE